jgi:hypothetical protein
MRSTMLRLRTALAAAGLMLLGACGGGNSTTTTIIGGGLSGSFNGPVVVADAPTGANTTEIVVDTGPSSSFALGAVNIPYVTVTLCEPGSSTACVVIDHVFLDTGSIGLRVFSRAVASLNLPALNLPADAPSATPAGPAAECYPFVLGAVWGAMASADVRIGGELAPSLPIQLVDDASAPAPAIPADCVSAANGGLLDSPASLQANGILGIGMIRYDCGLNCVTGNYAGGHTLYYSCPGGGCVPAAVPASLQMQNPIASFVPGADGVANDNGSIIVLPAMPELGASLVKGRLVFGIGTQANNQLAPTTTVYPVDPDPASATYLYLGTTVGATAYPNSYIDSGSNALFLDDASITKSCKSSTGTTSSGWYCPESVLHASATLSGHDGTSGSVDFAIANADVLFSSGNVGFANLGGSAGQGPDTFVWGLPFFFGRSVYTSIWGQSLSAQGPWNAF